MEKFTITNRHGLNIVTQLEKAAQPVGLAIVLHGLGGYKEQPHIEVFAQAFKDANYTVLRYDATHTFGESEGSYEEATLTGYYQDFEDVLAWAKEQAWYSEPFVLAGHSLGGMVAILYAEKYPDKVKALAPIATAVSGKLLLRVYGKKVLAKWRQRGYFERPSVSRPGVVMKINWGFVKDIMDKNILPKADNLTMPTLLIVGSDDKSTPLEHQQVLADRLPEPKEIYIIKGADHNFRSESYLKQIKEIFDRWIAKL